MADPITEPVTGEYKGSPVISIPVGKNGAPFTFGSRKAEAIIKYYDQIKEFYESNKVSLK